MGNICSEDFVDGKLELQFNRDYTEPQTTIPIWIGYVTINKNKYGLILFNIGNDRNIENETDEYFYFREKWLIYDSLTIEFDNQGFLIHWEPGKVLMWGYDQAELNLLSYEYNMNGRIEESKGIFSKWTGHSIRISGIIESYPTGDPHFATGKLRIS